MSPLSRDPSLWSQSPEKVNRSVIEFGTLPTGDRYGKVRVGPFTNRRAEIVATVTRQLRTDIGDGDKLYRITEIFLDNGAYGLRSQIPGCEQDVQTRARALGKIKRYLPSNLHGQRPFAYYRATLFLQGPCVLTSGDICAALGLVCDDPNRPIAYFLKKTDKRTRLQLCASIGAAAYPHHFAREKSIAGNFVAIPSGGLPLRSANVELVSYANDPDKCALVYTVVTDGSVTPLDLVAAAFAQARERFATPLGVERPKIQIFNEELAKLAEVRGNRLDYNDFIPSLRPIDVVGFQPRGTYTLKGIRACAPVFNARGKILIANLGPSADCLARLDYRNIPCLSSFVVRYLEQVQTPDRPDNQRIPKDYVDEILRLLAKYGRPIEADYEDSQPE